MKAVTNLLGGMGISPDLLPDWREQARTTGALDGLGAWPTPIACCSDLMHTATKLSYGKLWFVREQSIADISSVALLKRLRSSEGGCAR